MVRVVEGNLLDAKEDIIAHQVNCQGVMGSGVALCVKRKHPHVFEQYKAVCQKAKRDKVQLLGRTQFVYLKTGQVVANMFAQVNFGTKQQQTDYVALRKCFEEVAAKAKKWNASVAMPYMVGCGRGGGNWRVVSAMIEECFEGVDVVLYRLVE